MGMVGLIFEPHPPNFENQNIFWRLMNGKFDAYVLWPLAQKFQKFQNWIVDPSTARDFTVVWLQQPPIEKGAKY